VCDDELSDTDHQGVIGVHSHLSYRPQLMQFERQNVLDGKLQRLFVMSWFHRNNI